MNLSYSVKDAREHFSQILDGATEGAEIEITRRGKVIAKVVGILPPETDQAARRAVLRNQIPAASQPSFETIHELREERVWALLSGHQRPAPPLS